MVKLTLNVRQSKSKSRPNNVLYHSMYISTGCLQRFVVYCHAHQLKGQIAVLKLESNEYTLMALSAFSMYTMAN